MTTVYQHQGLMSGHVKYAKRLWVVIPSYTLCGKWIHKSCSGIMDSLSYVVDFTCSVYVKLESNNEISKVLMMGYEPVRWTDKFSDMGDVDSARGHGVVSENKSYSWVKEVKVENSSSNYDRLF